MFTQEDFKDCLGCFATGVTIVTIKDTDNNLLGVTINSFASVSLEPPLVLFSLEKKAKVFDAFSKSDRFIVNILNYKQHHLSVLFANYNTDKWNSGNYFIKDDLPILKDIICFIDCKKERLYEGGDHIIFLCRVKNLQRFSNDKPLLYFCGKYNNL